MNAIQGHKRYTVEEIAQMYGYSVSSLKNSFTRVAASIKKKFGVNVIKCKDVTGIYYLIQIQRALTIFEEQNKEIYIPEETIKMDDLQAYIIIAVAAMPQGVFRGTIKQFLDYIGLSHTKKNIDLFQAVVDKFIENEETSYVKCERDKVTITIYIKDIVEQALIFSIDMLRECRRIIEQNNKQSIKVIQLMKVWEAYRLNWYRGNNPITDQSIAKDTGLSIYQISQNKKLLNNSGVIQLKKQNEATYCKGTGINPNVFYDNIPIILKQEDKNGI